jgi:Fur family ferric uptake transcriptional regulator
MPDKIKEKRDTELKRAGLKITLPRMKILKILEGSESRHLSAEAIFQALGEEGSDIGLATVYRVLAQFEAAGLVTRHFFEGGRSVFELNEGEHHDHVVCVDCGDVDEFVDEIVEQRQDLIAEKTGYKILGHAFTIFGLCTKCRAGSKS